MPFALVVIGLVLVMSAIKGTQKQLGAQVVSDFSGSNSFLVWMFSIVLVGCLGYVPALQKFSRAFLALILVAIVLAHNGFFTELYSAIQSGPKAPTGPVSISAQPATSSGSSGILGSITGLFGGGGGGILSGIGSLFGSFL